MFIGLHRLTCFNNANIYKGNKAKLSGATIPDGFEGRFWAILNALRMSTVALIKASLASVKLDPSDLSTAILDSNPTIH